VVRDVICREAVVTRPSTRENNFDLLRLLAALQVAFFHSVSHLNVPIDATDPLIRITSALPGVPIFFVISGFLISLSWERNSDLRAYARNRALRIFPALWVCLAVSIATAAAIGGVSFWRLEALPWLAAQITIGQFYNPGFLRGYGVGVLNGSLWTIPIELQFYLVLPPLYAWLGVRKRSGNGRLLALAAVSVCAYSVYFHIGRSTASPVLMKLAGETIVPYLWMFVLGILLQRNFQRLSVYLVGRALWWAVGCCVVAAATGPLGSRPGFTDLAVNGLRMAVLAAAVVSFAFSAPGLSGRLLRGNDLSYGLYVYHMVVVNVFVERGAPGTYSVLGIALGITLLFAWASWLAIERPALARKRSTLHPVRPPLGEATPAGSTEL
jgi:peptidoglycan/LPS O-acetylase OafA/YrhL